MHDRKSAAPAGCRKLCNLRGNCASMRLLVRGTWGRRRNPCSETTESGACPLVCAHLRRPESCRKIGRRVEDGNVAVGSGLPQRHALLDLARSGIEPSPCAPSLARMCSAPPGHGPCRCMQSRGVATVAVGAPFGDPSRGEPAECSREPDPCCQCRRRPVHAPIKPACRRELAVKRPLIKRPPFGRQTADLPLPCFRMLQ